MTPQEILDETLARVTTHAVAWRAAAKHIHDKPAHERKPGDQQLITQLKALALQGEQIVAFARQQMEQAEDRAADPLAPAVRSEGAEGTLFGNHSTQVNNFAGRTEPGGISIQTGTIHGGVRM